MTSLLELVSILIRFGNYNQGIIKYREVNCIPFNSSWWAPKIGISTSLAVYNSVGSTKKLLPLS